MRELTLDECEVVGGGLAIFAKPAEWFGSWLAGRVFDGIANHVMSQERGVPDYSRVNAMGDYY
ncbi:MAG TPA: hypothetical protein VN680_10745 [Burkholderiaceae bacterium]|jgi:hypothetical protein|nr:hypothetical protein [Burkholderiaceae bacterium]